jgi:hypothetical protein
LDLSDAATGHPGVQVADAGAGPLLDRRALAHYRRRLAELDDDRAEADAWGGSVRAGRVSAEPEVLLAQLAEATALGGRARPMGGAQELARVAVRKAIAAAVARIGEADPALGRLLHDTVLTGSSCRYEPDPARPARCGGCWRATAGGSARWGPHRSCHSQRAIPSRGRTSPRISNSSPAGGPSGGGPSPISAAMIGPMTSSS